MLFGMKERVTAEKRIIVEVWFAGKRVANSRRRQI